MNVEDTIKQVKQKKDKGDLFDILEARDILLNSGFIDNKNVELQNAFYDIFPPSKEFLKEVNSSFKNLFSDDVSIRRKTSSYLEKQPRKSMNGYLQLWLKDPRTIDLLLKALDDNDAKVLENIILCLGNIADRYNYNDLNIYHKLVDLYDKVSDNLKITIAQSIGSFHIKDKWDIILKTLNMTSTGKTYEILGTVVFSHGEDMPIDMKVKFCSLFMNALLKENKISDVTYSILRALEVIGNETTINDLKKIKKPALQKGINELINVLKK